MAFINSLRELTAYRDRIEMQKEILPIGTLFTNDEKKQLNAIYKLQLDLIQTAITGEINRTEVNKSVLVTEA